MALPVTDPALTLAKCPCWDAAPEQRLSQLGPTSCPQGHLEAGNAVWANSRAQI